MASTKISRIISYSVSLLFFLFYIYQPAHAQVGKAVTIIPPKFELFSNPGDTIVEKIKVQNESDSPLTFSVVVEDFTTSGEEGQVVLEGEDTSTYSLARWIEPETKDLILQPNEERSINFLINVPRDAEPGGHYASILFSTGADQDVPGSAVVAQRIGSLILLRVSGNVNEQANIESFSVPGYSEKGPVNFSLRVKNEGNVHVRPEGTYVIQNLFGNKIAEIPLDSRNVIPGSIRKMDTLWDQQRLFGRYKVTLFSTYGEGSQKKALTAASTFTVASKTAIVLISVIVVALLGIIITLISGRKRLAKAMRVITKG